MSYMSLLSQCQARVTLFGSRNAIVYGQMQRSCQTGFVCHLHFSDQFDLSPLTRSSTRTYGINGEATVSIIALRPVQAQSHLPHFLMGGSYLDTLTDRNVGYVAKETAKTLTQHAHFLYAVNTRPNTKMPQDGPTVRFITIHSEQIDRRAAVTTMTNTDTRQ